MNASGVGPGLREAEGLGADLAGEQVDPLAWLLSLALSLGPSLAHELAPLAGPPCLVWAFAAAPLAQGLLAAAVGINRATMAPSRH